MFHDLSDSVVEVDPEAGMERLLKKRKDRPQQQKSNDRDDQ